MPIFTELPPISLYIHLPWCVQKCPYCDFNSHALRTALPEDAYVDALLADFDHQQSLLQGRQFISIFFGGGTPSLFSGKAIERILRHIDKVSPLTSNIEITLEANPGTVEQQRFVDFVAAGVNRLSLGIQSFDDQQLKRLGRIHDSQQAHLAILAANKAGFQRINLDLMYGLPEQASQAAMLDLQKAFEFSTTHLSWYQLTLEPNTVFYKTPPPLPPDDLIFDMQQAGIERMKQVGLIQYEVSAYAAKGAQCQHNLNYWQFGDYLGIGAGAHSKITELEQQRIIRFAKIKQPLSYMQASDLKRSQPQVITDQAILFEFMLNALRLNDGIPIDVMTRHTGLTIKAIEPLLQKAMARQLLEPCHAFICPTPLGKRFLNDLVAMFL